MGICFFLIHFHFLLTDTTELLKSSISSPGNSLKKKKDYFYNSLKRFTIDKVQKSSDLPVKLWTV